MEMLKRWSIPIRSSQSKHASSQSQTSERPASSSSLFSRFSKAYSSRKNGDVELSDLSVPQDRGGRKPCSSNNSEYEAMPPARALAARERVKNMKAMLRYPGAVSDTSSTQSEVPALVGTCLHHERSTNADVSSSAQEENGDADTKKKLYPNIRKVIFAIDGSLESHVTIGLKNREEAVPPPPSPAKSASEGSTTMELDLDGTTLFETSMNVDVMLSTCCGAKEPLKPMNGYPTEHTTWSSTEMRPTMVENTQTGAPSTYSHHAYPTRAERDLKHSSTPSIIHTPTQLTTAPQPQAILPISLTPVRNPPATTSATTPPIRCRVCAQPLFQSRIVCSKPKAWKIHSGAKDAAHYLHVECLRDANGGWERDAEGMQCARCDAFRGMLGCIDDVVFRESVGRMEKMAFGC